MATETLANPKLRKTWRDYFPPDAPEPNLITRGELLARLEEEGVEAKKSDVLFWQLMGVLPYPIKRWRDGATHSWYPEWFPSIVRRLRELQDEGYPLEEIGPQLENHIKLMIAYAKPEPTTPEEREAWSHRPQDLEPHLRAVAKSHEFITGTKIPRVEVRLFDENGHPLTYSFDIDPN